MHIRMCTCVCTHTRSRRSRTDRRVLQRVCLCISTEHRCLCDVLPNMHEVLTLSAFVCLFVLMTHAHGMCLLWHCITPKTTSLSAWPDCGMLLAESVCLCEVPGQPEGMMVGCKGSVTLDARFDAGYFCTVKVGRLEFKGTPSSKLLQKLPCPLSYRGPVLHGYFCTIKVGRLQCKGTL